MVVSVTASSSLEEVGSSEGGSEVVTLLLAVENDASVKLDRGIFPFVRRRDLFVVV